MSGDGHLPAAPPGSGDPASAPPPPPPPPPAGYPPHSPSSYSWAPGPGKRPRPAWQLAVAILVAGIIAGVAVAVPLTVLRSSKGSGSPSPAPVSGSAQAIAIYRQTLAAMRSTPGFHYVAVVSGAGGQHTVGDAGASSGRQDITLTSSYGDEHFTLLLVNRTVYFQGNVPAFEDQLGVPAAKASGLASSWISVTNGDGPYSILEVGITAGDQADETTLEPASVSQVTVSGGSALRLQGAVPPQQGAPAGTGQLDVAANDHHPLSYSARITDGTTTVTSTVDFTNWAKAPSVSAPSGAVAWSTLGASPPPGGYGSGGGPGASPTPQPAF